MINVFWGCRWWNLGILCSSYMKFGLSNLLPLLQDHENFKKFKWTAESYKAEGTLGHRIHNISLINELRYYCKVWALLPAGEVLWPWLRVTKSSFTWYKFHLGWGKDGITHDSAVKINNLLLFPESYYRKEVIFFECLQI